MHLERTKIWRRCMVGIAIIVLVGCLAIWFATRQIMPRTIRIATGQETGLYPFFYCSVRT
ncbi:MAG: hypothetical protein JXM70_05645 [Pirellulales bacterium]|nr:hypothetical protein [Pirellulales bacterium]